MTFFAEGIFNFYHWSEVFQGVWGILPQKILKIRCPDWLNFTFLHEKCHKINYLAGIFTQKGSKNASRLKPEK